MSTARKANQQGFTLVEILMVVVIIGIAGAVIIPQIGNRDDLKVSSATRLVMADLIYAQNMAITTQKNHYLVFDTSGQSYSVVAAPAMSVLTHPVNKTPYVMTCGPSGAPSLRDITLVSATFKGATTNAYATVGFDELGTPQVWTGTAAETMSSGAIVLQAGANKLQIDIEPYTGQISVKAVN